MNADDVYLNPDNDTIANAVANETDDGDTIYLDQGTYNHTHLNGTNGINITKNLTIIGQGSDQTIIDAQNLGRIFNIISNGTLTLINLTLINGNTTGMGGAIYNNGGKLTVNNCLFSNNNAEYGGAIYDYRSFNTKIINSNFINNSATRAGGAIYADRCNNSIVTNSNFINNSATGAGGAYMLSGSTNCSIDNSSFSDNKGPTVVDLNYDAYTTITNSIFTNTINSNNTAMYLYGGGGHQIINCSIGNYNIGISTQNSVQNYVINSSFTNNSIGMLLRGNYNLINNSNFTNNNVAINITGRYTDIISSNIINNSQGIFINSAAINTTINYNRIFNNTDYDLNNMATDTNADYNWWGNNTPTKIIGITPNNYFIMNVTNLTSLNSNGTVTFQYTFRLNTGEDADNSLLPYFITEVYTNLTSGIIESFDARYNNTFDITINNNGSILYTFVTDNEIQTLEGNITLPPEPPTPTPEPNNNNTNNTINNPTANAAMKTTGIPIIAILFVLLTSLGLIIRRKQN